MSTLQDWAVMDMIRVAVSATDELDRIGVVSLLTASGAIVVLEGEQAAKAEVVVLVRRRISNDLLRQLRASRSATREDCGPRYVVVAEHFDERVILAAAGTGVRSVVPMAAATGTLLVATVLDAAAERAHMPTRLQGALLRQLNELRRQVLEPAGISLSGLGARERDVLRLLAEGLVTEDIGIKLSLSERTVKNILYGLMNRTGLRNRTHAVAFAVRSGAC